MTTISFTRTKAFRVTTPTGHLSFELVSSWNGLEEWCDAKGRTLVVAPPQGIGPMLDEVFGAKAAHAAVIKAHPDLLSELGIAAPVGS